MSKHPKLPEPNTEHIEKHFNTAGPNIASLHYELDPLVRIDQHMIKGLIAQQRYFVLHAPRQTGKTTCLFALRDLLNKEGRYAALYANIEGAQAAKEDTLASAQAILSRLADSAAVAFGLTTLARKFAEVLAEQGPLDSITIALRLLAESLDRPVVLFIDEVDALVGNSLISLLRQIRAGYGDRPRHFPHSIVLCGVRDVRDYRMTLSDGEIITGGSAFNIKAESLRLGNFSREELEALYAQHTGATGQQFTPAAIEVAWVATQGQPWLVNALAEQAVWRAPETLDRTVAIDEIKMRAAREALILRNDSHLDQLADKLKEPRVRSVIEPMLTGNLINPGEADRQYLLDLGLIRVGDQGLMPANGIYAEVLPRVLASDTQSQLRTEAIKSSWKDANGKLNPSQFMANFFAFWLAQGEAMMNTVKYHEAAPTLVLMAYLQRVVNGAGRIEREYAAGSGRMDLLVVHNDVRMAIEVKVWRDKQPNPLTEGVLQLDGYLARHALPDGFLVIFDQRTNAPEWLERMSTEQLSTESGRTLVVMRG